MPHLSPLTSCIFLETEGSMMSFGTICAAACVMISLITFFHPATPWSCVFPIINLHIQLHLCF